MRIRIYQMDFDRDTSDFALKDYSYIKEHGALDSSTYNMVYSGDVNCNTADEVYEFFNERQGPQDYLGRFLCASDVIELDKDDGPEFHYIDLQGYTKIDFQPELTEKKFQEKLDVVILEPGKKARIGKIGADLESMQRFVGGMIEPVYPFDEPIAIICNEEGKLLGLPDNRALRDENNNPYDVINGKAFICSARGDDYSSLTREELKTYSKMFECPEMILNTSEGLKAIRLEEYPMRRQRL